MVAHDANASLILKNDEINFIYIGPRTTEIRNEIIKNSLFQVTSCS